jgi:uncharacterized integral membrane protein
MNALTYTSPMSIEEQTKMSKLTNVVAIIGWIVIILLLIDAIFNNSNVIVLLLGG